MSKSSKGSSFEREICKQLSLWWTDNKRDDIFWRTSGSGARATTRRKTNKKTRYEYGDVSFTDPIGKFLIDTFLIELKRGYTNGISLLDFLDKKTGKDTLLLEWWKKAEEERKYAKRKYSLIIFRRDRKEACILMERSLAGKLEYECGKVPIRWICINLETKDVMKFDIFLLSDFFKWISPAIINILTD